MDVMLTVNIWFLVSLCLICLVIGLLLGGRAGSGCHYWKVVGTKDGPVSTETPVHVIELYEGCLTIGTKKFPDDCVSLTREETEDVVRLLLI
jgi:hypothetical protein